MMYPLTFRPILKEKVWGGRFLEQLGKALPQGAAVGESWELADLPEHVPDGRCIIANGPHAGRTLRDVVTSDPAAILGAAKPAHDGGFPLLIKYLDARDNLSVQVHPSPAYAAAHRDAFVKDEAWVVIHAEPGAKVYIGLKPDVSRERFVEHIGSDAIIDDLHAVSVSAGDCFCIPSGTVHALGAGIVLAEIQTPSDTTFRLYDWGRENSATARPLHIEQALQCIDFTADQTAPAPTAPIVVDHLKTTPLARMEPFAIERIDLLDDGEVEIVTSGIAEVWMMLSGRGQISSPDWPMIQMRPGQTILMPAAMDDAAAELKRGSSILRVTLPSPLKGMIA